MSEEQKKIIKDLADKLPSMTERERGYLEGTIATAAAMSKKDKEGEKKEKYRKFSRKMYQWVQSEKDCRELKTAINLYAYMHREKGAH